MRPRAWFNDIAPPYNIDPPRAVTSPSRSSKYIVGSLGTDQHDCPLHESLTSTGKRRSGPEAQSEADFATGAVGFPDLAAVTAHPGAGAVALTALGPHGTADLLEDIGESSDGVGFADLLCIKVLAHRDGQLGGGLGWAEVGGGGGGGWRGRWVRLGLSRALCGIRGFDRLGHRRPDCTRCLEGRGFRTVLVLLCSATFVLGLARFVVGRDAGIVDLLEMVKLPSSMFLLPKSTTGQNC